VNEEQDLAKKALEYHERSPTGKIFTGLSKPVETQTDLSIAYSPGVAAPCLEIHKNQDDSFRYTGRGNLVAVITNGTAVLGLGNIGPYAAKPVMEGKAMLFKKYADIDVFDIELDCDNSDDFIKAVKALEPTFGGINLEDIKAPECFYIEEKLRELMAIPVMHDDQHGTAIIAGSAFLNALEVAEKKIDDVKVVFSGGGAAAIACASLFLSLGVRDENLVMCDSKGVIHLGRNDINKYKGKFSRETKLRTLTEALVQADAFVGVSVANVLTPEMIKPMAENPIIFALANPDPEIRPDIARKARPDAIIATGRSDFPNQVNNVLGFPFIFRGALDVRAKVINEEMKLAAVRAIAALAKEDVPDVVMAAYKEKGIYRFGRDYLIPKPVDPRVLFHVAPAVAKAAMESGVARRSIDIDDYKRQIERVLGPTQKMMRSLRRELSQARSDGRTPPMIVIPHSYDRRMIRAAEQAVVEGEIRVCMLGDSERILKEAAKLGVQNFGTHVQLVDPLQDKNFEDLATKLFEIRQRKGVSRTGAYQLLRNNDYYAAMMVHCGLADGMLSGLVEPYGTSAKPILEVIGHEKKQVLAGIYMIMVKQKQYFFADCTINISPSAETLAGIALTTANVAKSYTSDPVRVAMLSFTSFGATRHEQTLKVAEAVEILRHEAPGLEVEGEMQADVALNSELRNNEFPFSRLQGDPNVLIFPDLDAANISYKLLTNMSDASPIGPILVGVKKPANVLQRSATTEEVLNMLYLTAHQVVMGSAPHL
jgi:malate dehydrogenase (oxaloacetate-decarboxylating)(NADP+)